MNIEKTISEQAVSDILTPMLESQDRIVTEDVAPLFDQATGLDTPPASGTVTTTIEESRSVISAIIRKAWTATLTMLGGASVLSYIAAAYTYLRNRLQGNETYGIPDRRSEISASSPLAANLALLNDRKISVGENDVPDGLSMMHFLGDSSVNSAITKIGDDNTGWTCDRAIALPVPVSELTINCVKANGADVIASTTDAETLILPHLESTESTDYSGVIADNSHVKHLVMPEFKECKSGRWTRVATRCSALETIDMPKSEVLSGFGTYYGGANINSCASLWYVRMGKLRSFNSMWYVDCPKIIHLEICGSGGYQENSISFSSWNPTYVLSTNPTGTDLIEEGSTAQNNLQQFLSNFKTYIAERLADNGSGKTLTLSQAVFSEIWDSQGQPQVKEDGLDQLRADIHRIIRTVKQWAVNKA